jgi:N-acetylglutamate synthase-like GNAT family acetyltransferase
VEPDREFQVRLATFADILALEELIPMSVRALQAAVYTPAQMEAAIGTALGVDRQLIADGTYFCAEHEGAVIGCGGWSRRNATYGGDRDRAGEDALLDPATDPARIRAFFVHPQWARSGIGTAILERSESAARAAGFREAIMVATLAGEPLYARHGYRVLERLDAPLPGGVTLPVVRMAKALG